MNIDLSNTIAHALAALCATPTSDAARAFFAALGYSGTRTFPLSGLNDFLEEFDPAGELRSRNKAYLHEWRSIDLLFQLTDDDLTGEGNLFTETRVDKGLMRSYLFFHIVLKGDSYPRSKLAQITRQVNRLFTMPIMVLFSYGSTLSIAVINRRRNKIDANKDVLGKVTLIHGIRCADPHRGHLDILASFSIPELARRGTVSNFDTLHAALEEVFNVELLNRTFYRKIQTWFFWAVQEITFPHGGIADPDQRNRIAAIRLLTRVIFCWFAREKGLVPPGLFTAATARKVLKDFDPLSRKDGTYYTAILQNLFFPTLSVPLDQREFRNGRRYKGVNKHYMRHEYFRHEAAFKEPGDIPRLFEKIPFLNGGLFACLDYLDKAGNEVRVDGFSDTAAKQPLIPNLLFFGKDVSVDIRAATGSPTDTAVKIDGLFTILDAFKFTVTENTPVEEEIALDPELLGRIFENLLAEYNPETEKSARKQTGSFYTPRPIVDYMVTESLKAYLESVLCRKLLTVTPADAKEGLDILFSYTEREHAFSATEKSVLIDAIYDAAILDPACGSGAFPMGMLQKLVYVLDKLDHGHDHWKKRILADTPAFRKDETRKWLATASADFTWKLGLVQRSIYGIDIQPFAVQIAKLRCFVSLLVDFDVDPAVDNFGVPSLPNLDFKFVAANTLIRPPGDIERADDSLKLEDPFFEAFAALAEEYFFVRDPAEKKNLQEKIEKLIEGQIDIHHRRILAAHKNTKKKLLDEDKRRVALWESYRNIFAFRNGHVGFFDPRYFFPEIKNGFDIVISNPPYGRILGDEVENELCQTNPAFCATKDAYVAFTLQGLQIASEGGYLMYIMPTAWLGGPHYRVFRKELLKSSFEQIVSLPFDMFACAYVDTLIVGIRRKAPTENHVARASVYPKRHRTDTLVPSEWENIPQISWATSYGNKFLLSCEAIKSETEIAKACRGTFGDIVEMKRGVLFDSQYLVDHQVTPQYYPYFSGDVYRYEMRSHFSGWLEFGSNLKEAPATFSWFEGERILLRRLMNRKQRLMATLANDTFITNKNLYSIKTISTVKVKAVLAILNSTLISRLYVQRVSQASKDDFPQVTITDVLSLPFPVHMTGKQQNTLITLADCILAAKTAEQTADVTALEAEVDSLVYDLYGVTDAETASSFAR